MNNLSTEPNKWFRKDSKEQNSRNEVVLYIENSFYL